MENTIGTNKITHICCFEDGKNKITIIKPHQTQEYITALFNLHLTKKIDAIYFMTSAGMYNYHPEKLSRAEKEGYLRVNAVKTLTRERKEVTTA